MLPSLITLEVDPFCTHAHLLQLFCHVWKHSGESSFVTACSPAVASHFISLTVAKVEVEILEVTWYEVWRIQWQPTAYSYVPKQYKVNGLCNQQGIFYITKELSYYV